MDSGQFDDLMRAGIGTRRLLLRMAGSAIGGVIMRLGLGEDAEAKSRKHGHRHGDHERQGHVQAAGKKHKKHKNKHHGRPKPPKDAEPEPDWCDPTWCKEDGGKCCHGECIYDLSVCCYPEERTCGDGSCLPAELCCGEERTCPDGTCIPRKQCCSNERMCPGPDGGCMSTKLCCLGERRCGDGSCRPLDDCCPDEPDPECDSCSQVECFFGEKTCRTSCLEDDDCCNGTCLVPCSNGCRRSTGCSGCTSAPAGKVYCEGQNICVDACPDGQEIDSETCQCKPKAVCSAGIACAGVPEGQIPDGHGGWLAAGCCPNEFYKDPCNIQTGETGTCCEVLREDGHSYYRLYCSR